MPKMNRSLKRQTRALPISNFETREAGDGNLTFRGYASTFNEPYSMGFFTEQVAPGAFAKTLSESPDVRLLVNHAGLPLARTKSGTLSLSEDATGLMVEAQLDANDPDVLSILPKMARGDVDQMSFAFRIVRETWSPDYSQCDLVELALDNGDVSLVTYPANPATSATLRTLRTHMENFSPTSVRELYAELAEIQKRYGAQFSASNMNVLQALLSDLTDVGAAIDDIGDDVTDASSRLSDLVGGSTADDSDDEDDDTDDNEQTNSADDDNEERSTSLTFALAQAQALRLRV